MFDMTLTDRKIPVDQLISTEVDEAHGAQVLFVGNVRNHNEGKKVLAVSYDAFTPLVLEVFKQIGEDARKLWGQDLGIQIWHRTGRVELAEASVLINVTSRHRDAAYLASRFVIEELKQKAPIWKREHYADGDSEWLQGHVLRTHAEIEAVKS